MYNVGWGPNRIVNSTRRDLTQKLENLDQIRDLIRKRSSSPQDSIETMSSPKPTFQNVGNRNRATNGRHNHAEPISPQHQELVRFFHDSWDRVCKELESGRQNGQDSRGNGVSFYRPGSCHPELEDFKPFDMEAFWGYKAYINSTQSR